jgi:dephospho-CoA kinase
MGAGKGTIVEYLVDKENFTHYSVRGFLLEKIRELGLPENRDSMFYLANLLRADHGPSYVVDELYEKAVMKGNNSVIESVRTTGEVTSLRSKGPIHLFAVDADPFIRYERIKQRATETDMITLKTFMDNELRESVSMDPGVQNLHACIRLADFTFYNNGTKEQLYQDIELVLESIITKS